MFFLRNPNQISDVLGYVSQLLLIFALLNLFVIQIPPNVPELMSALT